MDVTHYEIHLNKIDFADRTLDAVTTITLTAKEKISGYLILKMLARTAEEYGNSGKEENVMAESNYVLITAIVNRGFSGEVMNAARAAGARGGTVMHSRCIANENVIGPLGFDVQDETEIVMILAPSQDKMEIMKAITENCGVHSEANGIVLSLPIESVIGI